MRLALISPLSRLDDLKLTNIQMMLPYLDGLPADRNPEYLDAYRQANERGDYIILDNGVAERTVPASWNKLLEMAHNPGVSEIVLPDVMGNAALTKTASYDAYKDRDTNFHYMYVVQGRNNTECLRSVEDALDLGVSTIGIPRHLVETVSSFSRYFIADFIVSMDTDVVIHLLGTSPAWVDEIRLLNGTNVGPYIRSVDTSAPYRYAAALEMLPSAKHVVRKEGYFGTVFDTEYDERLVEHNVTTFLKWAN